MIRVVLVDDQQLVRAGLRALCAAVDDLEVVGEAGNGAEAVRIAARERPDVVLMDLHMPGTDGIEATRRIHATQPTIAVVILTTFDDDDHLYPALAAGAAGFLVKDATPEQLVDGVHRAAAGEAPFSPAVLHRVIRTAVAHRASAPAPPQLDLTPRESDVLALVAEGLSNAEIADRLHLGVTTIKTHVANLMAKTGADNRVRLALTAVLGVD